MFEHIMGLLGYVKKWKVDADLGILRYEFYLCERIAREHGISYGNFYSDIYDLIENCRKD